MTPSPTTPELKELQRDPTIETSVKDLRGAEVSIRKLCHYDVVLLEKLGSPIIRQIRAIAEHRPGTDSSKISFEEEDIYELIYLLSVPPREARSVIARGKEAFRQTALERVGFGFGAVEVGLLMQGVLRELASAAGGSAAASISPAAID